MENQDVSVKTLSQRVQLDERIRSARELACVTAASHADKSLAWIAEHIFDSEAGVTLYFCLGELNVRIAEQESNGMVLSQPAEVQGLVPPARTAYWETYIEMLVMYLGLKKQDLRLNPAGHGRYLLDDFE